MTRENDAETDPYEAAIAGVGSTTLAALVRLERALRYLDPTVIEGLRAPLRELLEQHGEALGAFTGMPAPGGLERFHENLAEGASLAGQAVGRFSEPGEGPQVAGGVLEAMRLHARAQEVLYPLRATLPPLGRYFVEPAYHDTLASLDEVSEGGPSVGLHRAAGATDERRAFTLYVPEWWDGRRALPLVVALHGGMGDGRDFIWTWLREARGRGFLLLAPSSRGSTWSLQAPPLDRGRLHAMVDYVREGWNVDPTRILCTGLSDGGTYSLLCGLAEQSPFTHLAPIASVLHPLAIAHGAVERARGKPIYLVHGARDWMFPVELARSARETLEQAGAELIYREIEDLSHAYPREENDRILRWLDPELALPEIGSAEDA